MVVLKVVVAVGSYQCGTLSRVVASNLILYSVVVLELVVATR